MRLTLRTLLAQLLGLLEPEDSQAIEEKISGSSRGQQLAERIPNLVTNPELDAPRIDSKTAGADPNMVAEYLDGLLSPEKMAQYDRAALKSDRLLAEVASCFEVLSVAHQGTRRVSQKMRQRVYRLGTMQLGPPSPNFEAEAPDAPNAAGSQARRKELTPEERAAILEEYVDAPVLRPAPKESGESRSATKQAMKGSVLQDSIERSGEKDGRDQVDSIPPPVAPPSNRSADAGSSRLTQAEQAPAESGGSDSFLSGQSSLPEDIATDEPLIGDAAKDRWQTGLADAQGASEEPPLQDGEAAAPPVELLVTAPPVEEPPHAPPIDAAADADGSTKQDSTHPRPQPNHRKSGSWLMPIGILGGIVVVGIAIAYLTTDLKSFLGPGASRVADQSQGNDEQADQTQESPSDANSESATDSAMEERGSNPAIGGNSPTDSASLPDVPLPSDREEFRDPRGAYAANQPSDPVGDNLLEVFGEPDEREGDLTDILRLPAAPTEDLTESENATELGSEPLIGGAPVGVLDSVDQLLGRVDEASGDFRRVEFESDIFTLRPAAQLSTLPSSIRSWGRSKSDAFRRDRVRTARCS